MACLKKSLLIFSLNKTIIRNVAMSANRLTKEVLEKLETKNPYYEKYADKIAKLQNTSPEEFLQRIEKVAKPKKDEELEGRSYSELLNPKPPKAEVEAEIPYKKLSDIMKIDLIKDKNAEEISKIWTEYYKTHDVLAATLTVEQFDNLMNKGKKYPIFILPLPRSEGFEFIMLQFAGNAVHFTPLLSYQVHGENAPECLTLVHYTEKRDKGIILMRGEYDTRVLKAREAQCLANELQMFYCKPDKRKEQLLETFNNKGAEFKHMDVIKEVENIQLV